MKVIRSFMLLIYEPNLLRFCVCMRMCSAYVLSPKIASNISNNIEDLHLRTVQRCSAEGILDVSFDKLHLLTNYIDYIDFKLLYFTIQETICHPPNYNNLLPTKLQQNRFSCMGLCCVKWRKLDHRVKGAATITSQWIDKQHNNVNLIEVTLCWIRLLAIAVIRFLSNET